MKLQLLLLGVIISSCSLSEKERNETAIITCNILSETRNFQSSERIKEINKELLVNDWNGVNVYNNDTINVCLMV